MRVDRPDFRWLKSAIIGAQRPLHRRSRMEPPPGASASRASEWFVPSFGHERFRSFIGLLFLPYTGMVLAFLAIGAALAPRIIWGRLLAIEVIYFLALAVGAHALDALGSSEARPWGEAFTRGQLRIIAFSSIGAAYAIAVYYMLRYVPLLWPMALCEGFFVFAYNLEWFHGRFHSDSWFAFSWGFLPTLAGYIIETNAVSIGALVCACATALFSIVEIRASRPYKTLKKLGAGLTEEQAHLMIRYESILKGISLGTILMAAGLLVGRAAG